MRSELMQAMIDRIASECVAVRLRMLNRVVTNISDAALLDKAAGKGACHKPAADRPALF